MENIINIIKESKSIMEVCKKLLVPSNGKYYRIIRETIEKENIDISHFDGGKSKRTVYQIITKNCPVCKKEFETKLGSKKEKLVCSRACSNTHFRTGENHPNWKDFSEYDNLKASYISKKYRKICFKHHEHKCVICDENLMLDVHHYDGDKKNNEPNNLIPMCATHHNYIHSKYKYLVVDKVNEYRNKIMDENPQ